MAASLALAPRTDAALLRSMKVRAFYDAYSACLDGGNLEGWCDFFTDDAFYCVQSAENHVAGLPHGDIWCDGRGMLEDRVSGIRVMVYEPRRQRRFVSGVQVSEEGGMLRANSNFMLVESMIDRDPIVALVGRSSDVLVEQADGSLLLKERLCVYDNYRVFQNIIVPV